MSVASSRIYLASRSPRRRELLKQIGVSFDLLLFRDDPRRTIDVDETPHAGEAPSAYVLRMAETKARAAADSMHQRRLVPRVVLGADTTVAVEEQILGKPVDVQDAERMLRLLSGRAHEVQTAICVVAQERCETRLSTSTVEFAPLDERRIRGYLDSGEPMDKAGAYGIQGRAGAFIRRLSGSYSGVMGLPLYETAELLRSFDVNVP